MPENSANPTLAALETALSDPNAATTDLARDDYRISLPCFEGPLDLLLHLIRRDQLNIYDIHIAHICKSYLEHLELMHQLDFNVAGEFMVMAATLMYLKSLTLLPQDEVQSDDEDPRMPLVAQLLEYERFKKASLEIDERPWLYRDNYPRPPGSFSEIVPTEALLDVPIEPFETFQLLVCLKAALDRTHRKPIQIETDTVSIRQQVAKVTEFLQGSEFMDFVRLLPAQTLKQDIIVSFLAILELAKLKFIEILQSENFGSIQIRNVREMNELNLSLLDQY